MSEFDDNIICMFTKSAQEALGFAIIEWKGVHRIDIRIYVQVIGEDSLIPTKKGISLRIDEYPKLLDGMKLLGNVMGNEKMVARIEKSKREEVRIGITTFRNQPLIYLRTFTLTKSDEPEWIPTQKGISLKVEFFPKLLEAVEVLGTEIEKITEEGG